MATRVRKITPDFLKKIVAEEARKLKLETLEMGKESPEDVKPDEVDAGDYADTLAKDIDHLKALKIYEQRLQKTMAKIQETKNRLRSRIKKNL